MSYSKLIYHLVFPTHKRERTINEEHDKELYSYIIGVVSNSGGYVYAINGAPDHVHVLLDIPPSVAVTDYVRSIKQRASLWLRGNTSFPLWNGWGRGFSVFSCSPRDFSQVLRYIDNQKEHHKRGSYEDELRSMLLHIPPMPGVRR